MFKSGTKKKLDAVMKVVETHQRGIFKRIDENRELLELLQEKSPHLLEQAPWVVSWLKSQDQFLSDLAEVADVTNHFEYKTGRKYPRPWPLSIAGGSEK